MASDVFFERLQISRQHVEAIVGFLHAYANTCVRELDALSQLFSDSELEPNDDRVWTIATDAASTFREAGQWALMTDVNRGRSLLSRSATLFAQLEHGFGPFLEVIFNYQRD